MNKVEYQQMANMEKTYWWHIGRNRIINDLLIKITKGKRDNKILNIGCGTGGTIPVLEKFGKVTNVDTSKEVAKYLKKNGIDNVVLVDSLKLPFKTSEFDIVVGFDVLEHIDDQKTAIKEWNRVLKRGGNLFLTVPAYQWLWSEHDVSLHHFRRYTRKRLTSQILNAAFEPKKVSYAIAFSLPMIVAFRFVNKLKNAIIKPKSKNNEMTSYVPVPSFVNSLFSRILFIESRMLLYVNFVFGTTVMAIAENVKKK